MITDDCTIYAQSLPPKGALMSIDLGTKTLGLALCDISRTIASAKKTLKRGKFGADKALIQNFINEHQAIGIVIGLPKNMDGSEGPRAQSSRAYAKNLSAAFALPILMWDERLSTAAVTRTMLEADLSRQRQKQVVDNMAAAYILQGVLDFLKNQNIS